jgi:hypothetical protein
VYVVNVWLLLLFSQALASIVVVVVITITAIIASSPILLLLLLEDVEEAGQGLKDHLAAALAHASEPLVLDVAHRDPLDTFEILAVRVALERHGRETGARHAQKVLEALLLHKKVLGPHAHLGLGQTRLLLQLAQRPGQMLLLRLKLPLAANKQTKKEEEKKKKRRKKVKEGKEGEER